MKTRSRMPCWKGSRRQASEASHHSPVEMSTRGHSEITGGPFRTHRSTCTGPDEHPPFFRACVLVGHSDFGYTLCVSCTKLLGRRPKANIKLSAGPSVRRAAHSEKLCPQVERKPIQGNLVSPQPRGNMETLFAASTPKGNKALEQARNKIKELVEEVLQK